jgi:exodeoxyribonuclease VII large subunit
VLKRRFPAVDVILYPVAVQGESAARQIAAAIRLADERKECDVLIVGRGGGSLEDLWSFNDEQLARTLFACELPIISAVGHEIDFTITDFVADVRAPTPSAAAEIAVPDARQLLARMQGLTQRLTSMTRQFLAGEQRHLQHLQRRLPRPDWQLAQQTQLLTRNKKMLDAAWQRTWISRQQQLDYLAARLKHPQAQIDNQKANLNTLQRRLEQAFKTQQQQALSLFSALRQRLNRQLPDNRIARQQQHVASVQKKLHRLMQQQLDAARQMLAQQVRTLAAVSPLNTLARGYSITTVAESGEVITRATDIEVGQSVQVRLHQGRLDCEVKNVSDK